MATYRSRAKAPTQLGSRTGAITIEGMAEVHAMLAGWIDPKRIEVRNAKATKAAAKVISKPLKASATQHSTRMGKAVWVHAMKGNKGAMIVGHHKRKSHGPGPYGSATDKGDFWPMVIGGTKNPHTARKPGKRIFFYSPKLGRNVSIKEVRGVPPAPIVDAVWRAYGDRAMQVMAEEIEKG